MVVIFEGGSRVARVFCRLIGALHLVLKVLDKVALPLGRGRVFDPASALLFAADDALLFAADDACDRVRLTDVSGVLASP
eukprot:CAMPEP_0180116160 /NCGR_PEP_ID=MMETSP0986-20121125/212_1 /TAXON_ID=697907 /ORGANISM="non described non described, Strain CCMP2293" /LENGTH=79 /DNA_ID=CAMNT_0022054899 /DNA_START=148 /DNA_END=384 /DNA_ORIENTATION=-